MTAWEFLRELHETMHFQTREGKKVGRASNSELRRWIQNQSLIINGESVAWNEVMDFPMISVRLFTRANTITIW